MSNIYYIYAYVRSDGTPYYIGKGSSNRAWVKSGRAIKPPKDKSKIVVMESNLTEIGAFALERRYIRWYGRKNNQTGILHNMTDGGEGCSGIIHSEQTRKQISASKLGKKHGPYPKEHGIKISNALKGRTHSELHRENLRKANRGKKLSEKHKNKISLATIDELNPFYGKSHSIEVRNKISQTQKTRTRNPHSTETRRKIGEANKRRVISEETRNKMRESAKLRWGRESLPQQS
jgi:hypothetical protein